MNIVKCTLLSLAVAAALGGGAAQAQISDNVVKKLNTRWHVKTVPAGTGAFPLNTCD